MFVMDTDTLTLFSKGHPKVVQRHAEVPSSEVAIAVVTRIEALLGRFSFVLKAATVKEMIRAQQLLDATDALLAEIPNVLPLSDAAGNKFEELHAIKKLKKIGRADLLIAAITLVNRATLVTRNLKDFREVPGLQVENWAD